MCLLNQRKVILGVISHGEVNYRHSTRCSWPPMVPSNRAREFTIIDVEPRLMDIRLETGR